MADIGHILEHLVDDACVGADFHTHHNQLTVKQFKPVPGPCALQRTGNLLGRQHLGIDKVVDAKLADVLAPLGVEEFVIVNTGNGLFGAQALGHRAGQDVACLALGHRDEQVAGARLDGVQVAERDGAALMGEQVIVLERLEFLVINVHDDDILLLVAEHLG